MAKLIGALVSIFFLFALATALGGVYGLAAKVSPRVYNCPENEFALASGAAAKGTTGPPNRALVLGLRALFWPWSAWRAIAAGASPLDWIILRYDWAPDACKAGPGMLVPPAVRV